VYFYDVMTGERIIATKRDLEQATIVADALENIDVAYLQLFALNVCPISIC